MIVQVSFFILMFLKKNYARNTWHVATQDLLPHETLTFGSDNPCLSTTFTQHTFVTYPIGSLNLLASPKHLELVTKQNTPFWFTLDKCVDVIYRSPLKRRHILCVIGASLFNSIEAEKEATEL